MEEKWRIIEGYPYYEISNTGKVRSINRILYGINGHKYSFKSKERKLFTHPLGYKYVTLKKDGKAHRLPVHRLVAMTFIPNPQNKPCVNHIDNNPSNNRVDNLEWCTNKENSQWMLKQGRADRTEQWLSRLDKGLDPLRKPVIRIDPLTGERKRYRGVNEVAKDGFLPSSVSCVCRGIKYHTHRGYRWEYEKHNPK